MEAGSVDLGADGLPSLDNRVDLAKHIAASVLRDGHLIARVERLDHQELADVCWAGQLAGRLLAMRLSTRVHRDPDRKGVEIRVEPQTELSA